MNLLFQVKGGGNITREDHRLLCDVGIAHETVVQVTEREDEGYNPGEYAELDDTRKQVRKINKNTISDQHSSIQVCTKNINFIYHAYLHWPL